MKKPQTQDLEPGARVILKGKHPHGGYTGELVEFGPYGPRSMGLKGWLVKMDDGTSCYAKGYELEVVP